MGRSAAGGGSHSSGGGSSHHSTGGTAIHIHPEGAHPLIAAPIVQEAVLHIPVLPAALSAVDLSIQGTVIPCPCILMEEIIISGGAEVFQVAAAVQMYWLQAFFL